MSSAPASGRSRFRNGKDSTEAKGSFSTTSSVDDGVSSSNFVVGSGTYLATRTVLSLLLRTSAGTQTSLASGKYILLVAAIVVRWRCAAVAVARAACAARRAAPREGGDPLRFRTEAEARRSAEQTSAAARLFWANSAGLQVKLRSCVLMRGAWKKSGFLLGASVLLNASESYRTRFEGLMICFFGVRCTDG